MDNIIIDLSEIDVNLLSQEAQEALQDLLNMKTKLSGTKVDNKWVVSFMESLKTRNESPEKWLRNAKFAFETTIDSYLKSEVKVDKKIIEGEEIVNRILDQMDQIIAEIRIEHKPDGSVEYTNIYKDPQDLPEGILPFHKDGIIRDEYKLGLLLKQLLGKINIMSRQQHVIQTHFKYNTSYTREHFMRVDNKYNLYKDLERYTLRGYKEHRWKSGFRRFR